MSVNEKNSQMMQYKTHKKQTEKLILWTKNVRISSLANWQAHYLVLRELITSEVEFWYNGSEASEPNGKLFLTIVDYLCIINTYCTVYID